jgi:vancomycin permeability regulator SanA
MTKVKVLLNTVLIVTLMLLFLLASISRSETEETYDELENINAFCELIYPTGTSIHNMMFDYCVERQKEYLEKTEQFYEEWDLMVMTQRNTVASNIYINCKELATNHGLIDYSLMYGCIESSINSIYKR